MGCGESKPQVVAPAPRAAVAPLQSSSASPYASPPQKKAAPPHPSKVVPDYTVKFAKVESDDGLDVFYCVSIPETNTCLDELPDNIQDIQDGLCLQVLDKPMRLLSIQLVLSWSTLHVYEDADLDNRCITKPYRSVPQQVWDKTAVLSWRWGKGKPGVKEPGYMPMTDGQFDHLKKMLRHALADGMEHVWIDWTCVPQYASDTSLTMAEVSRSRLYYARAKAVLILPALKPLEETGGNGSMSITRALLGRIQRAMRAADASGRAHSFTINGQPPWAFTQKLVETLKNRNEHASYEYFGRVWTLVERMARYGRKEKLCQWLPVDMWLGMCLDVLLTACQEGSSTASDTEVYWSKLFSKEMRDRQQELLGKLRVAMSTKVMDDVVALADDLASFLVDSVQVWATTSLEEEEQPSKEWLKEYLPGHSADGPLATYKAWNTRDAIFSVVNYFSYETFALDDEGFERARDVLWKLTFDRTYAQAQAAKAAEEEARKVAEAAAKAEAARAAQAEAAARAAAATAAKDQSSEQRAMVSSLAALMEALGSGRSKEYDLAGQCVSGGGSDGALTIGSAAAGVTLKNGVLRLSSKQHLRIDAKGFVLEGVTVEVPAEGEAPKEWSSGNPGMITVGGGGSVTLRRCKLDCGEKGGKLSCGFKVLAGAAADVADSSLVMRETKAQGVYVVGQGAKLTATKLNVKGGATCVFVSSGAHATLDGCSASSSSEFHGAFITGSGTGAVLKNCTFSACKKACVSLSEGAKVEMTACELTTAIECNGLQMSSAGTSAAVSKCTFRDNKQCGAQLSSGSTATFVDCLMTGSLDFHGLYTTGTGSKATATNCRFVDNKKCGVSVSEGGTVDLTGCELSGGKYLNGLNVREKGATAILRKCNVTGNKQCGAQVELGGSCRAEECTFSGSLDFHGAYITNAGSSATFTNCAFTKNKKSGVSLSDKATAELVGCEMSGAIDCHGVQVSDAGTSVAVRNCRLLNNKMRGVFVGSGSSAELTGCTASGNDSGGDVKVQGAGSKVTTRGCTLPAGVASVEGGTHVAQ